MGGALVISVFMVLIFLAWFFKHKSKEEERKMLIEKDIDVSELPERKTGRNSWKIQIPLLKIGVIIIALAIGVALGTILFQASHHRSYSFAAIAFCGGIGLIIAHYID